MNMAAGSEGKSPLRDVLLNGLLFNLCWLAIVFSHNSLLAPVIVAAYLWLHATVVGCTRGEWRCLALVAAIGLLLDQFLFFAGVLVDSRVSLFAPLWLSCLWPVFATTLLHAFRSFRERPFIAAILGAVGGTGSYVAGVALSPISFGSEWGGPAVLAVLWAVLLPALLELAHQLEKSDRE